MLVYYRTNRVSSKGFTEVYTLFILQASPLVVDLLCKSSLDLHNQHAKRKACVSQAPSKRCCTCCAAGQRQVHSR